MRLKLPLTPLASEGAFSRPRLARPPHLRGELGGSLLALAVAGCVAAPHTRAAGAVAPLAVRPVAWNPSSAPVGHVRAVADTGSVVAVLGEAGATILLSGVVVATDRAVTDWVEAKVIRGADGAPRWIVGIDGKGRLYYLRGLSSFEDVSARFGLEGRAVRGAAMLDPTRIGFLLDGEVAIAQAGRVDRFAVPPISTSRARRASARASRRARSWSSTRRCRRARLPCRG